VRRVANVWDRFYHDHQAPWRGQRPIADLLPFVGNGPVLELGAGNGKLWRPLRAAGVDAVALDISWNVLSRLPPGPRVLADAAALPFADDAFSAVLDIHCTGHLDQPGRAQAALEIARVLKPGGRLIVERLGRDDLRTATGTPIPDDPHTMRLADGRMTHFDNEQSLRGAFEAAGLNCLDVEETRRHPAHRGKLVVRASLRGVFARPTSLGRSRLRW
jgi:SAM-dependent methyltransferase